MQADVARAGKGDEAGFMVLHEQVADGRAAAGKVAETFGREAGFEEQFGELRADDGCFARWLHDHGVAGDERRDRHAG